MKTLNLIPLLVILTLSTQANAAALKKDKQIGLGLGTVSAYPVTNFPYALTALLEGTYRIKNFGLSILATATSSPKTDGTYWFGSDRGGYQQTFVEPRVYLGALHLGFAVGLNLSSGGSGEIQSVASYGPMAGIEIPMGRFSLGVDGRYLMVSSGSNPTPLSTVLMFRFAF